MKRDKVKLLNFLKALKKLKTPELVQLLDHLDDNSINSLCECVYNLLYTDFNMTAKQKRKIKNKIKSKCNIARLKKISNKKTPLSKRRMALKMEGRGIGILLSAAIPLLANWLFRRNK